MRGYIPCRKIRRPIDATINAPLDLEMVAASPSFPFLSASDKLRNDLEADDRLLAEEDAEWRSSGARSPDPVASPMFKGSVIKKVSM